MAENKLNKFINEVIEQNKIEINKIALVGFSQGCMISLQTALKRKDKISCVIGYSGKIINQEHLNKNIVSKPEIYLMHGENDSVVPVNSLLEAKDFFLRENVNVETHLIKNCGHHIPIEASSIALNYILKKI